MGTLAQMGTLKHFLCLFEDKKLKKTTRLISQKNTGESFKRIVLTINWLLTSIMDSILANIGYYWYDSGDPRTANLPLMDSPVVNTLSVALYLFIVKIAGPAFMKDRKAFEFPLLLFWYNMLLVILSAWMFYEFMAAGWWSDYSYECEECSYEDTPQNARMVRVCWVFWLSKHIEFFDTYFFILKKKWNHISTLHVVHHTLMAFTWWFGVKFSPGGLGTFHAMVNSLVHTIMYFYYGISALGPEYRRYIWWKKYLTTFQMTQFVVVVGHMLNIAIRFPTCTYPTAFKIIIACYGVLFYYLFAGFFKSAYGKSTPTQKTNGVSNGTKKLE